MELRLRDAPIDSGRTTRGQSSRAIDHANDRAEDDMKYEEAKRDERTVITAVATTPARIALAQSIV